MMTLVTAVLAITAGVLVTAGILWVYKQVCLEEQKMIKEIQEANDKLNREINHPKVVVGFIKNYDASNLTRSK